MLKLTNPFWKQNKNLKSKVCKGLHSFMPFTRMSDEEGVQPRLIQRKAGDQESCEAASNQSVGERAAAHTCTDKFRPMTDLTLQEVI